MSAGVMATAVVLLLLPVLSLFVARTRPDRQLWEVALDLPLAFALDLLGILALSSVLRLDHAVWASRLAWTLLLGHALVRRRGRVLSSLPASLGRREVLLALVCAAAAVWLSLQLSRPCMNADRQWHIPLVSSMRGQSLPFSNVYAPGKALGYHYAGNVVAAALQALSLGALHASNALSVAHDVLFGATGAALGLFFRWAGVGRALPSALATLGVLLAGPITLFREEFVYAGYSFINYLRVSFRPHVPLAGLLLVGFALAILPRAVGRAESVPWQRTALPLVAVTAALALTDEASIGLCGLTLGATWLLFPAVVHPSRKAGVLVFVGLLAAVVLPNLLFGAAFAPDAPRHELSLVPLRSPGYRNPPVAFSSEKGRELFFHDMLAIFGIAAAGLLHALGRASRRKLPSAVFLLVLAMTSAFGLAKVDVDKLPIESHRFVTAAMLLAPLFGLVWAADAARVRSPGRPWMPRSAIVTIALTGAGAASTALWTWSVGRTRCELPKTYQTTLSFFEIDCRAEVARPFGSRPVVSYAERSVFYLVAGCTPFFTAGPPSGRHWEVKVGRPTLGLSGLAEIHRDMLPPGAALPVYCPRVPKQSDPLCRHATQRKRCRPEGKRLLRCELDHTDRERLLSSGKAEPRPARR